MKEGKMDKKKNDKGPDAAFKIGAIALAFLATGYQAALFMHKAAAVKISADRDKPDTVYIYYAEPPSEGQDPEVATYKKDQTTKKVQITKKIQAGAHDQTAINIQKAYGKKVCESFPFDPNAVSVEDLQRLGFSEKQAQSIDNYRKKGGRFRRKEDFSNSYVVADSVYRRLEKFIQIPKIDLNSADSATLVTLPGIGPFFASKMVSYRRALGGSYSYPEQLLDIYNFGQERYDGLSDLIMVGRSIEYRLWTLPEDSLALHPYISRSAAHGIVLYRNNMPKSEWTVSGLKKAGILPEEEAGKLERCAIATP